MNAKRSKFNPERDNEMAARVLAEWSIHSFVRSKLSAIAAKYDVAERSVWRWKNALEDDDNLSALYEQRVNELLNSDWLKKLEEALSLNMDRQMELTRVSKSLADVTESFKNLAEVKLTVEMLKADDSAESTSSSRTPEAVEGEASSSLPN
jgi:hypothetical protein